MTLPDAMRALLREELADLSAYAPREGDFEVRLDANEAPNLWSETSLARLAKAAIETPLSRYPDVAARELKEAIAARVGGTAEELVVGVGSDELIALLLTALDRPRNRGRATAVATTPSFVMYRVSARARGFHVVDVPLDAEWQLSVPSMEKAIETAEPNLVFLATPNNPTGNAMREQDLRAVIECAPRSLVVLDEAYAAYTTRNVGHLLAEYENVALLGTLSKIGLAGLRVGWLRANPDLAREIDKVRQPYNVPSVTQRMAKVALTELSDELSAVAALVRKERDSLTEKVNALGVKVTPSEANFLWIKTPVPASQVFDRLCERGVLVRSFHERGGRLGSQLRVTIGTPSENARFVEALSASL